MNSDMMRRMMYRDQARRSRRGRSDMTGMPMSQRPDEYARNRFEPRGFDSREQDYRYGDSTYGEPDYARYGDSAMRDRHYMGNYSVPFEVSGHYGRQYYMPDHRMDYGEEPTRLSEHELKEWAERLLQSVEPHYKSVVEKERVLKRADELGIRFEHFNKDEFYVTVLMLFTDFCKTLGANNIDTYLKFAKDWLCDDDIAIRYGEKLAVYHDTIVKGE